MNLTAQICARNVSALPYCTINCSTVGEIVPMADAKGISAIKIVTSSLSVLGSVSIILSVLLTGRLNNSQVHPLFMLSLGDFVVSMLVGVGVAWCGSLQVSMGGPLEAPRTLECATYWASGPWYVNWEWDLGICTGPSYTSNRELRQTSIRKRESLGKTLSTGDSGTSTLIPTEEDELEERSDGDNEDDEYNRTPHMRMHRNSVIDEWSIPYDEIKVLECIGHGPVGEVYKGYWHGDVAIKKFHLPDATADQLDSFKEEVSILKKTRHENVALFMGASLIPPNLAIVTSFCRGHILYKHLHIWSELFPLEKSLSIANQVAHGLGYLHARNIVHKDLNTKNIFLDKDKVVITDLGISSLGDTMRLSNQQRGSPGLRCERRCAIIPRTRLYYMAPEIVRLLSASPDVHPDSGDVYPYSYKTDVYAFGTVVYELLTKRFPFTTDHLGIPLDVASVIFMVGCGSRQDIKCAVPKKLKELVWKCWEKDPEQRPAMGIVSDVLAKLLSRKGYPARSPSFPTNLSKSAENLLAI
eukprot:Em0015g139a